MEVKHIERGRYLGNIDIPGSISTMDVGEIWHINPSCVRIGTVRNACSVANRTSHKFFSVNCPGYTDPCITITRLK